MHKVLKHFIKKDYKADDDQLSEYTNGNGEIIERNYN